MRKLFLLLEIKNYVSYLESLCNRLDSKRKIPGSLWISRNKKQVCYYHYLETNDPELKYLKKDEMPFIRTLAQQDYDQELSFVSKTMIKALKRCEKIIGKCKDPSEIYETLREERKALVQAASPDEEYAKAWLEQHKAPPAYFDKDAPVIMTEEGLRVRSKSEFMYATVFKARGIPFVFESKVVTKKGVRRPDFLVLNKRTKKAYYIEHFGMMGDPNYLAGTLEKLKEYSEVGIVLGDNLLASFEMTDHPLDIEDINRLIDKFLV